MDILITLLVFVAIAAIIWSVIQLFPLPEPMRIVVYVVFAVLAIILLLRLVPQTTRLWP